MGVCIYMVRSGDWLRPVDEWNGLAGNKALFRNLENLPTEHPDGITASDQYLVRPGSFAPWFEFVSTLPNASVFAEMLKRIEADPSLWLEFSY